VDNDKIVGQLNIIIESLERHYNDPFIAPNGKLEGLCLSIRGLKGIKEQLTKGGNAMNKYPYGYYCDKGQHEVEKKSELSKFRKVYYSEYEYPHPLGQYEDDGCLHGVCNKCNETNK